MHPLYTLHPCHGPACAWLEGDSVGVRPCLTKASSSLQQSAGTSSLGLWPLVTSHCLLCPQTDTSDPEKVVSAFLKVSSVFKDEATVRTAVQDAVGNVGWAGHGWPCLLAASGLR